MTSENGKIPLISFVVPCYRFEKYIEECLRSILNQADYEDYEIIVIDDASPDRSVESILRVKDSRIRFIRHEKNQGHIVTINEGLALARGKYVARIDGDDRYQPFFLKKTIPIFEKHPNVVFIHARVSLIDEKGTMVNPLGDHELGFDTKIENQYLALLYHNFVCAPTVIARNEAWKKALPIPDGFAYSDWYLSIEIARQGDFCFIGETLADYRVHPGNLHNRVVADRSEEKTTFRILDKIFTETEPDSALQTKKSELRNEIYASHYLSLTTKYLQRGQKKAARECFTQAIRLQPTYAMKKIPPKNLLAAFLPGNSYQQIKKAWRLAARLLKPT